MDQNRRLKLSAIFFGVFWTAGMVWWTAAYDPAHVVILAVAGALAAWLWHWMMGKYFRWFEARGDRHSG